MLEKIGLPAKPSQKGNNWVVDASHCQGCSSQFTFINRKHHCRRCGGIFCGTCTQQRMYLRGQGDSPVRICDPCKKIEEAARFEARHGHKGRAGRGSSSRTTDSINEDEVLADVKGSSSSRTASMTTASSTGRTSRMGSSNSPADLCVDETTGSSSTDGTVISATPEDLRQQAVDEKKKYKILKGEGKNEEALKAFKRGKELERQAHALEMDLRKSRRKVSSSVGDNKGQNIVTAEGSQRLRNQVPKDDLMSELKLMGWSDKDLENEGKKSKNVSVEGELLALIGEVSNKKKPDENNTGAKAEIAAHRRNALLLKKEGKIAEAKEELKKAKILERQAEEEELLGGAEDSDDEFADLLRSMDSQKEDLNVTTMQDFDVGLILPDIDNLGESNFEVTEDDMEDPELAGALHSLGWTEEPKVVIGSKSSGGIIPSENEASYNGAAARVSDLKRESYHPSSRTKTKAELQRELLGLKRKGFSLRREGKADEAEEVQKMAKALEDQIAELDVLKKNPVEHIDIVENSEEIDDSEVTENDLQDPALLGMLNGLGWKEEDHGARPSSQTVTVSSSKVAAAPRSKALVQRELLGMKRKALELRRKGEMAEAEEVSNKAKVLQVELEELDAPKEDLPPNNGTAENKPGGITESSTAKKPHAEEDGPAIIKGGMGTENADLVTKAAGMNSAVEVVHRSPVEQEILDHRKRALAFKREGNLAEAKEELIKAKLLERRLEEEAGDTNPEPLSSSSARTSTAILQEKEIGHSHASLPTPQPSSSSSISMPPTKPLSSRERFKIQQQSLSHKRQAMKLRREGRTQEAEAEFELAKALEAQLEEHDSSVKSSSDDVDDVMVEDFLDPQLLSALKSIGIAGANDNAASTSIQKPVAAAAPAKVVSTAGSTERHQLEEEIKAERGNALRLKRAGKHKDALEALKRAKLMERKLSELH